MEEPRCYDNAQPLLEAWEKHKKQGGPRSTDFCRQCMGQRGTVVTFPFPLRHTKCVNIVQCCKCPPSPVPHDRVAKQD